MSEIDPPGPDGPVESGEATDPGSRADRRHQRSARVRRRRRLVGWGIVGLIVVVVLGFVLWYELESHALGASGQAEIVQVSDGESVNAVASALSDKQVIGSTTAFRLYDLVHGSPTVTPGAYLFHRNLTFAEAHTILNGGPNVATVRIDPGLTLHEVATRVGQVPGYSSTGFEALAHHSPVHSTFAPGEDNLEGLLGSGTYLVLPGETPTTLLTTMVQRFDRQATAAGLSSASAQALGMTPYQVIIVASVVEKEGYYPKNMPQVARVVYNRLAKGTALQMDSTVLYALGQDGGTVTPQDLQVQSPYNTYLNHGLPPTPICMSSRFALRAAVHPPPGEWLFFVVVDKNGTEAFADTFAQQLANEQLAHTRGVG